MTISRWKVTDSRPVLQDRWMTLRADRCVTAAGVVLDSYYVQDLSDWVEVVAFDDRQRVLVTRQYRHGAGIISTEIPCGVIEPGERPEQGARRELLEETGCTVETIRPLPPLSPNPARYSNRIHAFVATGARVIQPQKLDDTEEIEFEFLPVDTVLALIDSGHFAHALHVASLFLALRMIDGARGVGHPQK